MTRTDDGEPDTRTRRSRRLIGWMLVLLLLAPVVLFLAWREAADSKLEAEVAAIGKRGEPVWFSDLAPKPIDPAEDGTALFMLALSKVKPPTEAFVNLAMAEPLVLGGDNTLLARELLANEEALALARAAGLKGRVRIPIDYKTLQPIAIPLGSVQDSRSLARLFAGRVVESIGANDQPRAVETVEDLLRFSELMRDEPILVTQFVRIANGSIGLVSLSHILAHFDLTPEQFKALDKRLAAMEAGYKLGPAVLGERAMSYTTMRHLPENAGALNGGTPSESWMTRLLGSGLMAPNLLQDAEFTLRLMGDMARNIDETGPAGSAAARELEARIQLAPRRFILSRLLAPALGAARTGGLRYRQKLVIARLAMRVDRWFAEHGKLPESLAELGDLVPSAMRTDVFTGQPLVYRITPDGFAIYSKGANGTDQGGGETADRLEDTTKTEVHYPPPGRAKRP